jgi:hypothetical protein
MNKQTQYRKVRPKKKGKKQKKGGKNKVRGKKVSENVHKTRKKKKKRKKKENQSKIVIAYNSDNSISFSIQILAKAVSGKKT